MKGRYIDAVLAANAEGRIVALATELKSGAQLFLDGGEAEGDLELDEMSLGASREALRAINSSKDAKPSGASPRTIPCFSCGCSFLTRRTSSRKSHSRCLSGMTQPTAPAIPTNWLISR